MEAKYSLYVNSHEDKDKIVSALTNNRYIVSSELEKDYLGRTKRWRIDIYNEPQKELALQKRHELEHAVAQ